jgi:putative oxidoreductase
MPTKTCLDATTAVADQDTHGDNAAADAVCHEDPAVLRPFALIDAGEAAVHRWLMRYNLTALRVSMGLVIFGFGVLKYFPGVSPAEDLVLATTRALTLGLVPAVVPNSVVMVFVATVECLIGLSLIAGRGLRLSIYLATLWVMGILSPLVLLPGWLFSGPDHAPTLEGQYVLKDLVFLTAVMAIATTVRRGTRH